MEPTTLSDVEAAVRLGISVHALRKWRRQGIGPAYLKLGWAVRYRVADLDAYATAVLVMPTSLSGDRK